MAEPPRLPACHPPVSFVWRPTSQEPFRPYSCYAWFRPDRVSWQGKDFGEAVSYADRVNRLHGFGLPAPTPAAPRWSWGAVMALVRRLTARPAPVTPVAPPVLQAPSATPLRRPTPPELLSLVRLFQRHNAPPLAELFTAGWLEEDGLTLAGRYAMGRAIVEAPTLFLERLFMNVPAALEQFSEVMAEATEALEERRPAVAEPPLVMADTRPPLQRLLPRLALEPAALYAA